MPGEETPVNASIIEKNMTLETGALCFLRGKCIFDSMVGKVRFIYVTIIHDVLFIVKENIKRLLPPKE